MAKKKVKKERGRWNGHKFTVSKKMIRGFEGLQIKGATETEDQKKDKAEYVKRKKAKPSEISMTINLNAYTGCDVRKEAMTFVQEAIDGKQGYIYIGGKKLMTCKMMLTDATVKDVVISPRNVWISADVQLTLKQSGKGGASKASTSSSGSSKSSSATSSTGSSSGSGSSSGATASTQGSGKSQARRQEARQQAQSHRQQQRNETRTRTDAPTTSSRSNFTVTIKPKTTVAQKSVKTNQTVLKALQGPKTTIAAAQKDSRLVFRSR